MTKRVTAGLLVALGVAAACTSTALAKSPFVSLRFEDKHEYRVVCAAGFECDVQLEPGERVNDGFNAHIADWDPHIGYAGRDMLTPHLVLRPSRPGLQTNIIVTTTKRTYYLLAVSSDEASPSYYSFAYVDSTFRQSARLALATQAALRAQQQSLPTARPAASVADLRSVCFDYAYSYGVDTSVQTDHVPRAQPSLERLPPNLVPKVVCSDGKHTYIDFPLQAEVPSDLPISLAVTAEGDTVVNYTYSAQLNRYTVDGVFDSFALELGSQARPLRLRIYHAGRGNPPTGRHVATPTPIVPPATPAPAAPSPVAPSPVTPPSPSPQAGSKTAVRTAPAAPPVMPAPVAASPVTPALPSPQIGSKTAVRTAALAPKATPSPAPAASPGTLDPGAIDDGAPLRPAPSPPVTTAAVPVPAVRARSRPRVAATHAKQKRSSSAAVRPVLPRAVSQRIEP